MKPPNTLTPQKNNKGWKHSLNQLLKTHNHTHAQKGKVISYATQAARREVLFRGFQTLRDLGYKLNDVNGFKGRHIQALASHWEQQGLKSATLQRYLSTFRTFCRWVGKEGMMENNNRYFKDKEVLKRTYIASTPKTWGHQGVDPFEKINTIGEQHPRIAHALSLQRLFGLRTKESLLLKPHIADKGSVLVVSHGTKGGRDRFVPIETEAQRTLLNALKALTSPSESLVPKDKTYAQYRNHYYHILKQNGITRAQNLTAHGLRHEHLNELYTQKTGELSPVLQSGKESPTSEATEEQREYARLCVAERAGHSRANISNAYLGK